MLLTVLFLLSASTVAVSSMAVTCITSILLDNTNDDKVINVHGGLFDWCLQQPATEPMIQYSICIQLAMVGSSSSINLRVGEDILSHVVNTLESLMLNNKGIGVCNASVVVIEARSELLPVDRSTCTHIIHEEGVLNHSSIFHKFDDDLYLKLQSENISLTDVTYVEFVYTLYNNTFIKKSTTMECELCAGKIIPKDEYVRRTRNGTRPFITIGTFHSDVSVFLEDGRVLLCDEGHEPGERPLFSSVPGGLILANVLTILSMIAILLTIITILVFPKLRNVPGIITMNLLVALFVALTSIVVAPLVRYPDSVCIASAVISHFVWLASFFWMNILSIDTSYILAFKPFSSSDPTKGGRYRLCGYFLYGWGGPGIIIAICLFLHFCNCTEFVFSYGLDDGICWTDDGASGLYFFGVPVAILLGINMILLFYTTFCMWKTSRRIRKTGKSEKMIASKREFLVFVKLFCLVGLPWIIGNITSFYFTPWLEYINIILNCLQGVFIFIALIVTGRGGKLWREKLQIDQPREQDGTPKETSGTGKTTSGATSLTPVSTPTTGRRAESENYELSTVSGKNV